MIAIWGTPAARLVTRTHGAAKNAVRDPSRCGGDDSRTTGDIAGENPTDDRDILLRAERSNGGAGRIYTLTYMVMDASGKTREVNVVVKVLKSSPNP